MTELSYEAREFIRQYRSDLKKAELPVDSAGRLMQTTKKVSRGNNNNPEGKNGHKRIVSKSGEILVHGNETAYKKKCRCPECRAAHSLKMRRGNKEPCIKGCGTLVWKSKKHTGMCLDCSRKDRWPHLFGGTNGNKSDLTPTP